MNDLSGKVSIVTGASKGIGAAIAKSLAAAGASVAVNYASSREGADKTVAEIVGKGGKAIAIQGDVAKSNDVQKLFSDTKAAFGKIDVVVNNAGVFKFEPVSDVSLDEFRRQFETNVLGPILTTQEALKHFPESGGSIINISSVVSINPPAGSSVYSSTKGALDTLTKALAAELGSRKIRVNTVAPGGTETEGSISVGIIGSEFETRMVSNTPLGRMGQPHDIAPAVVFLASDDSSWVNGASINVSGGLR